MTHEGLKLRAYQDSVGVWTIGYGTNLQELEIDEPTAYRWLCDAIEQARVYARSFPEYSKMGEVRKDVFLEMIYNMGPGRLAGFKKMLAAIDQKDWETAAQEMLDSKWASQVGQRAHRLAEQMRTGVRWNDGSGGG